ncbi:ABC transporter ATP-binding protein [Ferrimonas senticii]|uniref:ABC transporter ATP-binding protein n=1 Tax=Ferrimonas senticii TaxID=394566 RepID=UPI00041822F0|nr:ABC transporter ATP-binding protein [Ferrimonas senticii]
MSVLLINDLKHQWAADHGLSVNQLSVNAGEMVMLQGASGSGKTTLMNLIAGVLPLAEGEITLAEQRLSQLSASQRDSLRARVLGIVFQQFNLLPYLSVLDNVLLPLKFQGKRVDGSAKARAQSLLSALEMDVNLQQQSVNRLSVGQQQRVAAARALLGSPKLILADEPTSALDPDNRDRFMALLSEQCRQQGTALLLISHDPALQALADRRYQLQLTAQGSEVLPC